MKLQRIVILTLALMITGGIGVYAQQPAAKDLYFGYEPKPERRQQIGQVRIRVDGSMTGVRNNDRRNPSFPVLHGKPKPQKPSSGSNAVSPALTGLPGTMITIELSRNGKLNFVSPGFKFRSGDKIRLRLKTNFEGYVSVLNLGSSGKVNLLYPLKDRNGDYMDSYVTRTDDYQVPQGDGWIVFDNQKGTESVTVIMSAYPMEGLNNLKRSSFYFRKDRTSKDLFVQTTGYEVFAVCSEETLDETVGFTLKLRHS